MQYSVTRFLKRWQKKTAMVLNLNAREGGGIADRTNCWGEGREGG